ncbi:MAG TPA: rod shape-determining protein RodA [Thermoleophilaceae bacterium]|jgi:rod shape determining protein RodA|nr:rod shape-determining protein RodA [Thermoleophilaceae bacterium]
MQASAATAVRDFRDDARARLLRFDPLMLVATIGLIASSIYVVGNATQDDIPGDPNYFLYRQAAYAGIGFLLMLLMMRFDYSRLREWKLGIYGFLIASILLVYVVGVSARGSKRAISLPFLSFQPSELGKVLLVVSLAAFMTDRVRRLNDRETTSRLVLLAVIPAMLVIGQPDLGSGLVYLAILGSILFIAGTPWTHFAALGALAAAAIVIVLIAAPAVGVEVLKPYQKDRLTAFLSPGENQGKEAYQINQSLTAIGSGGKTGRGDEATQTKLDFLPEHHTDFVFSVVGEEFGFVGAALVLSLFALLIWRALRTLTIAKNFYGALVAGGITAMLMFQVFVNVGMTIGIMPITGIPLPLVSYGGSSVITTLIAIGLLQSIHAQARETAAVKRL